MTLKISTNPNDQIPRPVTLALTCDKCSGFLSKQKWKGDSFITLHDQAMKAGWLERNATNGREWLCPRCSGK